jgi:hypothetical protein
MKKEAIRKNTGACNGRWRAPLPAKDDACLNQF